MANTGSNYENKCGKCKHVWHAHGVAGSKGPCPECGTKNNVTRARVRSTGNFKHPVTPKHHSL